METEILNAVFFGFILTWVVMGFMTMFIVVAILNK